MKNIDLKKYFSLKSTLSRKEFVLALLFSSFVILVIAAVFLLIVEFGLGVEMSNSFYENLFYLFVGYPMALLICVLTPLWMGARFRDAGRRGAWAFLYFAGPLSLVVFGVSLYLPSVSSD